ncbi:trihelix transcription factor GT-2-like [Sitophilus oryzae]|uniref:Trihelix transcription factor GT-2-like n=1 Tax=Sitophilus oryzae TaxID=7048 RepID=A0A6J2XU98_SITOR|nr:trihelix transcription factor GT-2-like [Sitophilus oryzae]
MQKEGYNKDATMMRTKFKNLKAEYYKAKKRNDQSGVDPRYCPHFELLDELLGDRPSVTMEGVDTSLTEQGTDEDVSASQEESQLTNQNISETMEQSNREENTEDGAENSDSEVPSGVYEVSSDGYLSPLPAALPEGEASTSNATPKVASDFRKSKSHSVTPLSRNPTAVLMELKDSVQVCLAKIAEKEEKDDQFIEKLLNGQSHLLKQMTRDFIEGIGELFKKKRKRYYSSSSDESEDDKRKKRK